MSPLTAFIIGSGANIGKNTAAALKAKGYRVALGSRKPAFDQVKKEGYYPVVIDAASPESIKTAFETVNKELGPPNVVIYNAAAATLSPVPDDPLTLSVESFAQQTTFAVGVFAAAQEALRGFRSDVHQGAQKTFIITGNPLPWCPGDLPAMIGLHIQKTMEWRLTEHFASAYAKEKIRFYYATLVNEETGGVLNPLKDFFTSGPQHAQVYLDLITREDQAEWDYRFTLKAQKWKKE
ncbi:hypothetical protein FB451DRAFT_1401020 [Mycena latifolia]|nr:hypothetical protein FB451DRAFT_1401020 [Mycena latifolia]